MSAIETGRRVREGEVSAVEVVEAHLARIAEVNPVVNALAEVFAEDALDRAREIDRDGDGGPLAGVPFSVKDNLDVAGKATTHGVARFRDLVRPVDAPPVARLRAAGAIPIGHANLPTLTVRGMHTASELHGHTVNPWDSARTPGGSSGGDAVAVATGMALLGLGNDSGGSLRLPAMFTGVCGLKPSTGRYAADHRFGADDPSLASQVIPVDGPLARTVADLRVVHGVLSGADVRDPRAVPVPVTGPPVPRRVGLVVGSDVHPDVRAALDAAAGTLSDNGYDVEEVVPPRTAEALDAYSGLIMTEFAQSWPAVRGLLGKDASRYLELSMRRREPADLAGYLALTGTWHGVRRAWGEFLDDRPLLLGPVSAVPSFEPDQESRDEEEFDRYSRAIALCSVTSLVGVPAVAVPTGLVDGFPMGVQVIGRMYREDTCLDVAELVERAVGPW
ncbi:amidase family protein [Umezawaea sp. Da 62-37]|uniref:amidase n=1 Tax=Umezawaea sp. Da 62-37 TaxID=3075927 RepID=UPI0028F6E6E1|nr:amidase family protein [Umezawaea sp. Da 62-37]WNV84607.1 amidase family protein [Umezawaea sp. Da 62-37]